MNKKLYIAIGSVLFILAIGVIYLSLLNDRYLRVDDYVVFDKWKGKAIDTSYDSNLIIPDE